MSPLSQMLRRLVPRLRPARIDVTIHGGYFPSRIETVEGVPLQLVFDRREGGACSREVVFPDLDLTAQLAPYAQTAVELTPDRPGELPFQCGKGKLHGTLVVAPPSPPLLGPAQPRIHPWT